MRHRKGFTAHAMRMPDQIHAIAVGHRYQAVAGLRPSGGVGITHASELGGGSLYAWVITSHISEYIEACAVSSRY